MVAGCRGQFYVTLPLIFQHVCRSRLLWIAGSMIVGVATVPHPPESLGYQWREVGIRLTHQAPIPSMGEWKTILGT
jgi:hypothetical protein